MAGRWRAIDLLHIDTDPHTEEQTRKLVRALAAPLPRHRLARHAPPELRRGGGRPDIHRAGRLDGLRILGQSVRLDSALPSGRAVSGRAQVEWSGQELTRDPTGVVQQSRGSPSGTLATEHLCRQNPDGVPHGVACRYTEREFLRPHCGTPLGFDGYK